MGGETDERTLRGMGRIALINNGEDQTKMKRLGVRVVLRGSMENLVVALGQLVPNGGTVFNIFIFNR